MRDIKYIGIFYRDFNGYGGMPLEYYAIAKQLSILKYKIIVYCYGDVNKVDETVENITVKQFKSKKINLLTIPASFKNDLVKLKFFCFFLVSGHLPQNIAVSKSLIRNKIKYVFCPGGAYSPYLIKRKKMFVKIYKYFFELKVLKGADIVRTYSKTNQSFIEKYGYRGEFFELLEGINEKDLPLILNEIHFEKDVNKILYIGRIDFYNKGMDQLLLAFEKVKINNLKFKLDIYGPFATSNDQRILLKHLNNFNTDIVEYHGPIYGTKKFEILKKSDLLVLPSRFEGIPRVIRESLFYGTPVLVTKETNFAEYITKYKCGFVCRCEGNDIFDALIDFGNYQDKNELRINSEYLISEFYNWEKVRERLSLLIKRYIPDNYKNELNEIE